jgi:hypothetical protein
LKRGTGTKPNIKRNDDRITTKLHGNFISNGCRRVGTWVYDLEEAVVPPVAMEKKRREHGSLIIIMGEYQQEQ